MRIIVLSLFLLIFSFFVRPSMAIDCDDNIPKGDVDKLGQYIESCKSKINLLEGQQTTLKAAITVINSKIYLAEGQIDETTSKIKSLEKDILTLTDVIGSLTVSRAELEMVYRAKVREVYKNRTPEPLTLFLSTQNFSSFFTTLKYLESTRTRDLLMLQELEKARANYDQQKKLKIEKQEQIGALQKQLIIQKAALASQNKQKQQLLMQTQNDEKKFQALRKLAESELAAIEAIIAGRGSETLAKENVDPGTVIAQIIPSASTCSTGAHLHFEVVKNKVDVDPSAVLGSRSVLWDNSPDSPISFSGSWDWPLDDQIRITQTYGQTSYAKSGAYGYYDSRPKPHTGIDMVNDNRKVKAVRAGTLYQGSIPCGGGTLKYVHVKHKDDGFDTYYLHVNYY